MPASSRLAALALRDVGIASSVIGLWWLGASLSAGSGPLADLLGVTLGLALGALGFMLHEWSHLAGAVLGGSRIESATRLRTKYLFSFDSKHNSRRQFLTMSAGGFVGTGLSVLAAYTLLPDAELASRVARGTVLFLAFLGLVLEIPLVLRGAFGKSLPSIETFPGHRKRAAQAAEASALPLQEEPAR
jgi:hypothetical protein